MIYLDNAATSLDKPKEVADAIYNSLMSKDFGNPSRGAYPQSLNSLRELTKTRMALADYFSLDDPMKVVLTPNVTYGLNYVIRSLFEKGDHIITSFSEHNSVLRPLYERESVGCELSFLNIQKDFSIDPNEIESIMQKNTKAVVITACSNVSGRVTDLKKINEITKKYGLKLIIDGAQIAGAVEFSMEEFEDTIFLFTGHKSLHGPQGTGGILIKGDFEFNQVFSGGSGFNSFSKEQPKELPDLFEPGTANIHSFVGLKAAVEFLEINKPYEKIQELTKILFEGLKENKNLEFYSYLSEINGPIVSFNIKNAGANEVGQKLYDDYGICVRTGSHCAPLFHEKMGTKKRGIVRLSLSSYNTKEEVFETIKAIEKLSNLYK